MPSGEDASSQANVNAHRSDRRKTHMSCGKCGKKAKKKVAKKKTTKKKAVKKKKKK